MKNLTFFATFLCLILSFTYCTNTDTTSNTEQETTIESTDESATATDEDLGVAAPGQDAIPVDTFNTWVQNWKDHGKTWLDTSTLIAFNMPKVDLTEVLGETPDSTRFYLGLEAQGSGYKAKMMLVGVKAGQDMIDAQKGEYIYDYSKACPPYCGK